jgi:diacylglycerol kinase family enzyme
MTQFTSAALIVNAKSRRGQKLFKRACAAMKGLPFPVDAHAVEAIRTGRPKRIDLGMIDGDYFANCAAMGISPQIAETVPHGLKKVLGRIGYLGWATWQFARFKPFILTVDDGNAVKTMRVVEVRISNGPYHGGTWLVDEASINSGEIVVQAVTGRYKRTLAKNWAASFFGHDSRHQDTVTFAGKSLKIDTRPSMPISIDGEVLAHTPVTAKVAAGVIEVMVPA